MDIYNMGCHRASVLIVCALLSSCKATDAVKDVYEQLASVTNQQTNESGLSSGASEVAALQSSGNIAPSKLAINDLQTDIQCEQVTEDRDIWGRAMRYGGEEAKARLRTFISSDFEHADLTPADREFLRYLAYTTVWVPSDVEVALGKLYLKLAGAMDDEDTRIRIVRMQQDSQHRTDSLIKKIHGFPGEATVMHDKDIKDGAVARVGNLIVVSQTFLLKMDASEEIRDFVLAHELSHLYKRHTIKELQYRLISSAEGWELAKELLAQFKSSQALQSKDVFDIIDETISFAARAEELYQFFASQQLTYSQEQELEADACGLRWLANEGVDTFKVWHEFEEMLVHDKPEYDGPGYVDYHPTSEARKINAASVIGSYKSARRM